VQFILGGRHEELEEGYQQPDVKWKQLVPETLLHFLLILDTANKLVVFVQQLIVRSIQLLHHPCHPAVLALPAMPVHQLTVQTPARGALPLRAKAVDSHLRTIHADISSATQHLPVQCLSSYMEHSGTYHDILYRKLPRFTTKLPRCTRKLPNSRFRAGMFYLCSGPK
jgi:hypothetical protein